MSEVTRSVIRVDSQKWKFSRWYESFDDLQRAKFASIVYADKYARIALIESAPSINYVWFAQAVYCRRRICIIVTFTLLLRGKIGRAAIDIPMCSLEKRIALAMAIFLEVRKRNVNVLVHSSVDRSARRLGCPSEWSIGNRFEESPRTYAIISTTQFGIYGRPLISYEREREHFVYRCILRLLNMPSS